MMEKSNLTETHADPEWIRNDNESSLRGQASIRLVSNLNVAVLDVVAVQVKDFGLYQEVANEILRTWIYRFGIVECNLFGSSYNIIPHLKSLRIPYHLIENEAHIGNSVRKLRSTLVISNSKEMIEDRYEV